MDKNGYGPITVQELRKITKMSQSRFAAYFGNPTATLQNWEHERRKPPEYIPRMMERILELEQALKN